MTPLVGLELVFALAIYDEFVTLAAEPTPGRFLADLQAQGRLVHIEKLPARLARQGQLEVPLRAEVAHALPAAGLWSHQAEALNHIRAGRSTVIATGTASGKSLCFQLPIAEAVVSGIRSGTSLLLYPTKALAQDQLRSFGELDVKGLQAVTYDGDTPRDQRTWARTNANVVLTNPEMLHHGLLPHHTKWSKFFKRLEYVVIDELHVLRGVFGTHVSHLLRRLRRTAALYGADPTFVFCSATIGEPEALASELCGKPVVAVTDDGSPCAAREIALVQPAMIDVGKGIRQSPATETIQVVSELVTQGRRVIAFCGSRALTERVAAGIALAVGPDLSDSIRSYRSGYLSEERREIEAELAVGKLRAVVATSALELGVDIAALDAVVLCGFPGTIASLWQQVGRAGRSQQDSVAVIVAGDDQLDQWFVKHPNDLFTRPPEPAVINVSNPYIVDPHLGCAAYEFPLMYNDQHIWPDLEDSVHRLVMADELRIRPDRHQLPRAVWGGKGMPFHRIGLRSASSGEVAITTEDGVKIGTVEDSRAPNLVHPGAVYLHRGHPWKVSALDLRGRRAIVERHVDDTWTTAKTNIEIEVLDSGQSKEVGRSVLHLGMVRVTTQVTGYSVKKPGSRKSIETVPLELPPAQLDTTAIWYEWQPEVIRLSGIPDFSLPGALHAAEHAAIGILPLFTICDRWDVGGVSIEAAPQSGLPTFFIYDGYPGGAGIAALAYSAADRHLPATVEVLKGCQCTTGCPSCVQSPKCGNGNEPLDKFAALALLETTLGQAEAF